MLLILLIAMLLDRLDLLLLLLELTPILLLILSKLLQFATFLFNSLLFKPANSLPYVCLLNVSLLSLVVRYYYYYYFAS